MTIDKNKRSLVKNNPTCKDCETELIPIKNWKPSSAKRGDYLCRDCRNDRARANYAKNLTSNVSDNLFSCSFNTISNPVTK